MDDFDNVNGAGNQAPETNGIPPIVTPTEPVVPEADAPEVPVVTPAAPAAPVATPAEEVTADKQIPHLKDRAPGDLNLTDAAYATKVKLAKERKVTIVVPLRPGERVGAFKVVNINGYRFEIKKNVVVEVPESVANMILRSQQMASEAKLGSSRNINNLDAEARSALNS